MKAIFRGLSVSMLALVAAGCPTPNPTPLDRPGDVPTAFTAPVVDQQSPIWPDANWWVNFKADELPALMDTAQKENLDIAAAAARVLEAEATDGVAFATLLPTVNLPSGWLPRTQNTNRVLTSVVGTPVRALRHHQCLQWRIGRQLPARFLGPQPGPAAPGARKSARRPLCRNRDRPHHRVQRRPGIFHRPGDPRAHRHRAPEYRRRQPHPGRSRRPRWPGVSSNLDLAQQQAAVASQEATCPA